MTMDRIEQRHLGATLPRVLHLLVLFSGDGRSLSRAVLVESLGQVLRHHLVVHHLYMPSLKHVHELAVFEKSHRR